MWILSGNGIFSYSIGLIFNGEILIMENINFEINTAQKKVIRKTIGLFLGMMVLLTFFSNTINNFSLARVECQLPSSGFLVREIWGKGTVTAKSLVDVFIETDSYRRVEEVKVKVGEKVQKGQELVVLEQVEEWDGLREAQIHYELKKVALEELEEQIQPQLNAIAEAKELLERASEEEIKMQKLYDAGAATLSELKDASRKRDTAEREYRVANENEEKRIAKLKRDITSKQYELQLAEIQIEKIKKQKSFKNIITAPCDGIIKNFRVVKGTMLNNSKSVCTLAETDKGFEFTAVIDNSDAEFISVGDEVDISIKTLGSKKIKGKVKEIKDSLQQKGEKKDLAVEIPQEGLIGDENGEIYISKKTTFYDLLLPNAAIVSENGGNFVYVLKEKKGPLGNAYHVQKAAVSIADEDNLKTAIVNGISKKDNVVVNKNKPIYEGERVMLSK